MIFSLPEHPMHFVLLHNKAITDHLAGKDFVDTLIKVLENPQDTPHEALSESLANKTMVLLAPSVGGDGGPYDVLNVRLSMIDSPNWRPQVYPIDNRLAIGDYPTHAKTSYLHIHIRKVRVDNNHIGDQVSVEWFCQAYHADGSLTSIFIPRIDEGDRAEFIKDSVDAMIREWLEVLEAAAEVASA